MSQDFNTIPARYARDYADGRAARLAGVALDDFPKGDPAAAYWWRLGWRGNLPDLTEPSVMSTPRQASLTFPSLLPGPVKPSRRRTQAEIVADKFKDRRAAGAYGELVARALRGKD